MIVDRASIVLGTVLVLLFIPVLLVPVLATQCTPIPEDYTVGIDDIVAVSGIVKVVVHTNDPVHSQLPWMIHVRIENKLAENGFSWRWDEEAGWSVVEWDSHRVGDHYTSTLKIHFALNVYSPKHSWKPCQVKQLIMEAFRGAFYDHHDVTSYIVDYSEFHYCLWEGADAGSPGQVWSFTGLGGDNGNDRGMYMLLLFALLLGVALFAIAGRGKGNGG